MKYLFIISALILSFSCGKATETGCTPNPVANEKSAMTSFAASNGINLMEHSSGILYEIINPGAGATLTAASTVSAVYTGKLMNGSTFDATATPISFPLSRVIEGWEIGIPLIRSGGRIKLLIPSALAYSCIGDQGIPPNSPLYFDVTIQ